MGRYKLEDAMAKEEEWQLVAYDKVKADEEIEQVPACD